MSTSTGSSSSAALAAVVALCLLPWVAVPNGTGDVTFVMSWGLVNTNPWHALSLAEYFDATRGFGTLPWSLQVWPIGLGFHLGAVTSAASGVLVDREDPRVTVGLLVLSAVGSAMVWQGLVGRGSSGTIPVGLVATGAIVWWFYWPALRRFGGRRPAE
ncbi:TIGR04206 family protein [Halohasta salina]|uniref:TIGR04206 family protein n=1 Tax=Halohasta salina TaxID=2961621 RepID=UPI0020A30763|nr:TIGR04206 family protein [Halohasta salina]